MIEVKSGYGLDRDTELKMLRIARRIGETRPIDVRTSFWVHMRFLRNIRANPTPISTIFASHAARRLLRMNATLNVIIGVEAMCRAQGIEFREPLQTIK